MKKAPTSTEQDELRPEYDLSELGPGVKGKYTRRARTGTNLVLIDPELADVFPDAESVNRALRLLVKAATAAAGPRRRSRRRPLKNRAEKLAASASKR